MSLLSSCGTRMTDSSTTQWRSFAWQSAHMLGVSSSEQQPVAAVIDPEALLVLGVQIPDPRLHGELLDWSIRHAALLMPSRARRIAREVSISATVELDRWIATINHHTTAVHWNTRNAPIDEFEPSGKSAIYSPQASATSALRARALGGATARTEILRALHTSARTGAPRERVAVAHDAAVAHGQLTNVLDELVAAQLVRRTGTSRRQLLAPWLESTSDLSSSYWGAWSSLPAAPWRDVPRLAGILLEVDASQPPSAPRMWATERIERAIRVFDDIAQLGGPRWAQPRAPVLELHASAQQHARAASTWLITQLRHGST